MIDMPDDEMTKPRNAEKAFAQAWLLLLKSRSAIDKSTTVKEVIDIVRNTARSIALADGITFVRRQGDRCHYMAEDAISPLWLNRHFPLTLCISGRCMLEKRAIIIEDIYADPRVPAEAYRATFVHSLAMVPVGLNNPVAAIGAYWAKAESPAKESVFFLQCLAGAVERALERLPEDLAEIA